MRSRLTNFRACVLSVSLVLACVGCDLFTTRTPNSPDTGSTFIWIPATTISTLLANFQGALQVADAANYAKVFVLPTDSTATGTSKTYEFIPRSGVDRTLFNAWNVQSEESYLTKLRTLLPKNPRITVSLTSESIDQSNGTSGTVTLQYNLLLPVDQSSGIPSSVSGSLQFQVELVTTEQSTKEWRVVTWTDFALPSGTDPAWTDLKQKLSS